MTNGPERAPAGWYGDPHSPEQMRYFDGEAWTNHFHRPGQLPDIGSWLTTTFGVIAQHWPGALVISFVTVLVGNLATWFALRTVLADVEVVGESVLGWGTSTSLVTFVVVIGSLVWQGFGWLALNRFFQRAHYQAEPTIAEALGHAARRLPKYVGVLALVLSVAMAVLLVVAVAASAAPAIGVFAFMASLPALVWIGVKFSFLPAAIAAAPAGTSPFRISMGVSVGRFGAVLGRLALITLTLLVAANIIQAFLGSFGSPIDTNQLSSSFRVEDGEFQVSDFRFAELLPSNGKLLVVLLLATVVQVVRSVISTSAFMRLYLDAEAPSELAPDEALS